MRFQNFMEYLSLVRLIEVKLKLILITYMPVKHESY